MINITELKDAFEANIHDRHQTGEELQQIALFDEYCSRSFSGEVLPIWQADRYYRDQ